MKLLSFAIPCYNSEAYMEKCIESILPGGEDVEILIVNDGSKDRTAEIADAYAAKYPTICRAIHQENGGHGEAVNAGIRNATGLYFKVVDSDDWVDMDAYKQILDKLREFAGSETNLDTHANKHCNTSCIYEYTNNNACVFNNCCHNICMGWYPQLY